MENDNRPNHDKPMLMLGRKPGDMDPRAGQKPADMDRGHPAGNVLPFPPKRGEQ